MELDVLWDVPWDVPWDEMGRLVFEGEGRETCSEWGRRISLYARSVRERGGRQGSRGGRIVGEDYIFC